MRRIFSVNLGKYPSLSAALEQNNDVSAIQSEQQTTGKILQQEKTAAGILCQMKIHHGLLASKLQLTKDVLGIVATLGKVNDDNLSRLVCFTGSISLVDGVGGQQ